MIPVTTFAGKKVAIIAHKIVDEDVRSIAGTPSWLLVFFERLFAAHPKHERRLAAFFPKLELVIHGGVNFAPYRASFAALLEGSAAETREVYAASEGFIASADRGPGEGMRVMADNGLFLEFVPLAELDSDIAWVLREGDVLHRIAPPRDGPIVRQALIELTREVQAGDAGTTDRQGLQQFTRERMAQRFADCLDRCLGTP